MQCVERHGSESKKQKHGSNVRTQDPMGVMLDEHGKACFVTLEYSDIGIKLAGCICPRGTSQMTACTKA